VEAVDESTYGGGFATDLIVADQGTREGPFDPVLEFVRGTARVEQEALLFLKAKSTERLSDVGADGIGASDELDPDGPLVNRRPPLDPAAKEICERDRALVGSEVLEAGHIYLSEVAAGTLPLATSNEQPATRPEGTP
jgi:hypothetical protein